MRVEPGTYTASEPLVLSLMQTNDTQSVHFMAPRCVSYREIAAGEAYDIPETVNGYFYTIETLAQVKAELANW